MSWKASAWAKDQRLGSPSAKSLLMCLADYADPDGVIKGWASQSDLAEAAEVSERTAREWLQRLEEWGLVERQRQQRPSGARAADYIVLRFDCTVTDGSERCRRLKEGEEATDLPANSAGRSNRQPDADPTGNEAHPTGNQFRAYKDNPPNVPPLPSQQERAEARERVGDRDEDRKKVEKAYWRMVRVWPRLQGLPKDGGLKAFLALTSEEREVAERRFPVWLEALKAQGKDHVHMPSTYFGKRLFADVPDPQATVQIIEGKPWGPHWAGICHRALLTLDPQPAPPPSSAFLRQLVDEDSEAGRAERLRRKVTFGWPQVKRWHDASANRRSIPIAPEDEWLATLTEFVPVGTAVFEDWRLEYERRGWPWLPDPGGMPGVYFPAGGPGGLDAFEAAMRGNGDDVGQREAAE